MVGGLLGGNIPLQQIEALLSRIGGLVDSDLGGILNSTEEEDEFQPGKKKTPQGQQASQAPNVQPAQQSALLSQLLGSGF